MIVVVLNYTVIVPLVPLYPTVNKVYDLFAAIRHTLLLIITMCRICHPYPPSRFAISMTHGLIDVDSLCFSMTHGLIDVDSLCVAHFLMPLFGSVAVFLWTFSLLISLPYLDVLSSLNMPRKCHLALSHSFYQQPFDPIDGERFFISFHLSPLYYQQSPNKPQFGRFQFLPHNYINQAIKQKSKISYLLRTGGTLRGLGQVVEVCVCPGRARSLRGQRVATVTVVARVTTDVRFGQFVFCARPARGTG